MHYIRIPEKAKAVLVFPLLSLFLLIALQGSAGKRYWIGGGANKNWNTTTNWSLTSGGAGGAAVPGTSDSAYFDNGSGQCQVNATVNIKMLTLSSSFSDTLKQNAYPMTISRILLNGGNFLGGTSGIAVNTSFKLAGTMFTAPALMHISGEYICSSGSFFANNGSVKFMGTMPITGNTSFYNLEFDGYSVYTINDTTILTSVNTVVFSGSGMLRLVGGQIYAKGNLTQNNLYSNNGVHTTIITINGSGDQYYYGQTNAAYSMSGWMPDIKVNKSGGTLYLKDYVIIRKKWEVIQGNVDATTYNSTLTFPVGSYLEGLGGMITGKKNQRFANILVSTYAGYKHTFNVSDTIEITGTFSTSGIGAIVITGYINVKGDINLNNNGTTGGGTGTIHINGNTLQTINGTNLANAGKLCNVIVNKSGTLKLKNIVSVAGNWKYMNGNIDAVTDSATVAFCDGTRSIHPFTFYNLAFVAVNDLSVNNFLTTDTLTVLKKLTFSGFSPIFINNGVINALGDIATSAILNGGGTGSIHICGTENQTFSGNTLIGRGAVCNVKINKPQGTLYLTGNITLANGEWKYLKGDVDAGVSTVGFYGNGSVTCGTTSLNMFFYNFHVVAGDVSLTGLLNVRNNLTVNQAHGLLTNNYHVTIGGNFIAPGIVIAAANTIFTLNGTGSQTVSMNAWLSNVKIDKPSGKVYITTFNLGIGSKLTLTKGLIVCKGTTTVKFNPTTILEGGSNQSCVIGPVWRDGYSAFTFPVGDTLSTDSAYYHPISLPAVPGGYIYTARYYAKNPLVHYPTFTAKASSLHSISTCEYWSLTRSWGTSTIAPTLGWNTNSCNTSILGGLRVASWDGSQWSNLGQSVVTGNTVTGSIKATTVGPNTNNQYYTLARVPHLHIIDSRGLDSLSLGDTLRYTISGAGLTGTYLVGSNQNFYPDLPSIGSLSLVTLHLQTNSNQAIDLQLELTPLGTTQNPKIIVPVGSTGKPCSIAGCVEVGNPTKLNECLLKNCFKLSTTTYVVLKRELDGGYFRILNGDFRFKFDEAYNDNDGKLSYRLYDETHKLLVNTQSLPAASQYNSEYGSRCYSINLLGCYDNIPFGAGYYVIEVENSKKEIWTARIKNFNFGVASSCGP